MTPHDLRGLRPPRLWILDRDGTLITETGYLREGEPFALIPGVPEALAGIRDSGAAIAVATNQSAIARGWLTLGGLDRIHRAIDAELDSLGASVDAWFACPHHPTVGEPPWRAPCHCRKPAGGLVELAARHFGVATEDCLVVGDSGRDLAAATAAGAPGVLVRTGKGEQELAALQAEGETPRVADDLSAVVRTILA